MHLCRGVRPPTPNKCPGYDTKQSDSEAQVMLELRSIQSTSSLPLLPGPLWPGMVVPDRVLFMGQIELECVLMLNWIGWDETVLTFKLYLNQTELFEIELFWHLTECKQKTILIINWFVWNRIVYMYKNGFGIK